jgi:hypothetical protein
VSLLPTFARRPSTGNPADGSLGLHKNSGLGDAAFAKAFLAERGGVPFVIGSSGESAGALAGVQSYDESTDRWTVLGTPSPGQDYNGIFGWGHRTFLGHIYSGDRRGGRLYRHSFNQFGVYTGSAQIALVGTEDVFCGPVFGGKLWLGTFTGNTHPGAYTWDGTNVALVQLFSDFPVNFGGNDNLVCGIAVWRGYIWFGVKGSVGIPQTYQLWRFDPAGNGVKVYQDNSLGWAMCVHKGELVFVPMEGDAHTTAPYVLRGRALQQAGPTMSAALGNIYANSGASGVISLGDELFMPVPQRYFGVLYREGQYRYVPGSGVYQQSSSWFPPDSPNGPNSIVDARVIGDSLWLTGNQPVRLYRLPLGSRHALQAVAQVQQDSGAAAPGELGLIDLGDVSGMTSAQIDAAYGGAPSDGSTAVGLLAGAPVLLVRRGGKWNASAAYTPIA